MTAPKKKPDVKRMARMLDSFCRRYGRHEVEFTLYAYLARGSKADETFEWDEEACLKKGLYSMARWCRLMRFTSLTQRGLIEYGFFNNRNTTPTMLTMNDPNAAEKEKASRGLWAASSRNIEL